jgi:hypothetical protein
MREHGGHVLCGAEGETSRHSSKLISTSIIAITKAALLLDWTTHIEIASGEVTAEKH